MNEVPASQIFPAHWLHLSHDIRERLAKVFGVERTVPTEIVNNVIISDGRSVKDLANITIEKMREYVGDPEATDFYRTWDVCISKAKGELNPPKELKVPEKQPVDNSVISVEKPKKTGLEPVDPKNESLAKQLMSGAGVKLKGKKNANGTAQK